jgi:hypothetical protein
LSTKHEGDDGDWCLDSAQRPRMSINDRLCTLVNAYGPATIAAMQAEEAFIASVPAGPPDTKRFTQRRAIPGRERMLP